MARLRIVYSPTTGKKMAEFKDGELIWHSDEFIQSSGPAAPMVMNDIQPYQSMIDGSIITSRSQHRAHLKAHGCIEVGNETKHLKSQPMTPPSGLKQTLVEVANSKLRYK